MTTLILLKMLLTFKVGIMTTYSANDRFNPNPLQYCTNKRIRDNDLVVAHPKLPCGSKVWIYNPRTKRSVVATVEDRGPRRALVDASKGTTRALQANGFEVVWMLPLTNQEQ